MDNYPSSNNDQSNTNSSASNSRIPQKREGKGKLIVAAVAALVIILCVSFGPGIISTFSPNAKAANNTTEKNTSAQTTIDYSALKTALNNKITSSGISATLAFADCTTGDSFDINGSTSLVSASMIKLAIMAGLFEKVQAGQLSLNDYGATCKKMIAQSDNASANKLIDAVGMDNINAAVKKLGMTGTSLNRRLGDTAAAKSGTDNYTSAADVALLMSKIWRGEFYGAELSKTALSYLEACDDPLGLREGIPATVVLAHKTGALPGDGTYATSARHDGGIVEASKPFIIVVLTNGAGERAAELLMADIAKYTYGYLNK